MQASIHPWRRGACTQRQALACCVGHAGRAAALAHACMSAAACGQGGCATLRAHAGRAPRPVHASRRHSLWLEPSLQQGPHSPCSVQACGHACKPCMRPATHTHHALPPPATHTMKSVLPSLPSWSWSARRSTSRTYAPRCAGPTPSCMPCSAMQRHAMHVCEHVRRRRRGCAGHAKRVCRGCMLAPCSVTGNVR